MLQSLLYNITRVPFLAECFYLIQIVEIYALNMRYTDQSRVENYFGSEEKCHAYRVSTLNRPVEHATLEIPKAYVDHPLAPYAPDQNALWMPVTLIGLHVNLETDKGLQHLADV
jgi:hypothetical protein